ncbi:hypothetical protein N9042_00470 [bacterium]|nr:hypothetical protein [Akkermansiaceae bacterium]MDB4488221.1 hypothetical protein [bacterium]MDB4541901.1 hypothetical protein [bacterium]
MSAELIEKLLGFIDEIGISYRFGGMNGDSWVSGVQFVNGVMVVDRESLQYPGDLIYMAGLLATLPPTQRASYSNNERPESAHEMGAIAWSYAAARYLSIDPKVVFHDGGYQDGADQLIAQLSGPQPVGGPLLQWYGMCDVFPEIANWVRSVETPEELSV